MTDNKKVDKQLISDLQSGQKKTILSALEKCPSQGNTSVTPWVLQLMLHSDLEVASEAEKIIFSLKDSASAGLLAQALKDKKFSAVHSKIISAFWQAGLDAGPHLHVIIQAAIEGDFITCMECYSVLDAMQPEMLPADQVMECLELLNGYFNQHPQDKKSELLRDIQRMLQEE